MKKVIYNYKSVSEAGIKKAEEQIRHLQHYDMLTGLPNRVLFIEKLSKAIKTVKNNENVGAVLCLDLDDFKSINATLGHNYGDLLLRIVAQLLCFCTRNYGTVARYGGDEFLILISDIETKEKVEIVCSEIIESFLDPFEVKEKQIYCSASIGICLFDQDNSDSNEILKNSNNAKYHAKAKGKNKYFFFNKDMLKVMLRKKIIESALRNALIKEEFQLYYQPQIDVKTKKIKGLEALLRWNSSEIGAVSPEEFIPIAEDTGLIFKIGEWVINSACRQLKSWREKGYKVDKIAINISPVQIQDRYLLEFLSNAISKNGLAENDLEIEITEGTLIKSIEKESDILINLVNSGVKVSIDDFGKGYSSLNYLTVLPISTLKIDKSFIDRICDNQSYYGIVECIIQLSKRLGYTVIAEGVEHEEQYLILKKLGCELIQGYFFSRPLPHDIIEKMLVEA
ncbi:putative bifunctional diguanylate cyclase/phosphodiesterase [Clostridium sp.]|uniref:putative bifunctional diguanylate cyclase/phosphodiesterase n=1 Tax=Clostridium sp. TaxID=1506 RepID=UPI003D6CA7AD